jgi:hypothetical protein
MIILDCIQGSPEWHAARLGIPTASNFGKILTSTAKPSSQAATYMNELLAGWLAGKPVDTLDTTHWMERGTELEAEARLRYEIQTGNAVRQVGFVYLDEDRRVGCSPDGLIDNDGGLEIKCPKASTLVSYYGKGCPAVYVPQVQGQIWVCELGWVDFYVYHPDMVPYLFRVDRDEVYIRSLAEAVEKFNIRLDKKKEELRQWKM